jgi:hypothetical protein
LNVAFHQPSTALRTNPSLTHRKPTESERRATEGGRKGQRKGARSVSATSFVFFSRFSQPFPSFRRTATLTVLPFPALQSPSPSPSSDTLNSRITSFPLTALTLVPLERTPLTDDALDEGLSHSAPERRQLLHLRQRLGTTATATATATTRSVPDLRIFPTFRCFNTMGSSRPVCERLLLALARNFLSPSQRTGKSSSCASVLRRRDSSLIQFPLPPLPFTGFFCNRRAHSRHAQIASSWMSSVLSTPTLP